MLFYFYISICRISINYFAAIKKNLFSMVVEYHIRIKIPQFPQHWKIYYCLEKKKLFVNKNDSTNDPVRWSFCSMCYIYPLLSALSSVVIVEKQVLRVFNNWNYI